MVSILMYDYYVYELLNPLKDNQPFYVGKGKGNRCHVHLSETLETTSNPHKFYTIQQITASGLTVPIRKVSINLSEDDAYALEASLISRYGRAHIDNGGILTNICADGQPPNFSRASLEKQKTWSSNISKGNIRAWSDGSRELTDEIKENLSKGRYKSGGEHPNYGKSLPPSWITGLTADTDDRVASGVQKRIGQKRSRDTLTRMSRVQSEVQNRLEVRKRKSEALLGKPSGMLGKTQSLETRQKIGAANSEKLKGRKRDPEAVKKGIETRRRNRSEHEQNIID